MNPRLLWLSIFAVAMANLEAALVVYLRELYYSQNILSLFPLRLFEPSDYVIEWGREVATMVMLVSIAFLLEKSFVRGFAVFVYLMGLWDLFYYIWLKVMIGWPTAWGEWDLLFLIPWPWVGPWICPAGIALLFVIWGGRVLQSREHYAFSKRQGIFFVSGAVVGLVSFLQPVVPELSRGGIEGLKDFTPERFWWPVYFAGLILMAAGFPWKSSQPKSDSNDPD